MFFNSTGECMNCDDLYEKMKDAWNHLGVGFRGKHLVKVFIDGAHLVMEYEDTQVRIKL